MEITGLDELQRELEEASRALEKLDGELGSVSFDPSDPATIDAALKSMERTIDGKVGRYRKNAIIGPLINEMKETYRNAILERAREAQLQSDNDAGKE